MLDEALKGQLKTYLNNLREPVELVASLDDGERSTQMLDLLRDLDAASDKVALSLNGRDARKPSFAITRAAGDAQVRFDKPRTGTYDVWIGTFGGGTANATLLITETP